MPDYLPRPIDRLSVSPVQSWAVHRAQQRARTDVYLHGLEAARRSECDQIDTTALADAVTTATEEELRFVTYGMDLASGNPAKLAIVASKAQLLANVNNRRIARRFQP
jgi:hypothetical protein